MRVLGDRVLVLLEATPPDVVTDSGIVLMRDPDYRKVPTRGIVAQLGAKAGTCDLDAARSMLRSWFDNDSFKYLHHVVSDCDAVEDIRNEVDRLLKKMAPAPFDVAVGDCIIFSPGDGEEVELDGSSYVILREGEILGVVEPVIGETKDFNTLSLQRAYEELQAAGLLPEG